MPLMIALALLLALPAQAKRPQLPPAAKVPSIEEVVSAEGFTPTPSQSEIYRPGAVLVPNGRGGHDVVVESCVDVEPSISIMSQSSIATTLAGGVSARLGMARGAASAGVEKRLSFVDPEQRTIPLAKLIPTTECTSGVQTVEGFKDLSSAIVLHDVLVAIIKNSVCTKADAAGGVVALGAAEASAFSECVQESDGQVPLGYKALPLRRLISEPNGSDLAIGPAAVPQSAGNGVPDAVERASTPTAASANSTAFRCSPPVGMTEKSRKKALDKAEDGVAFLTDILAKRSPKGEMRYEMVNTLAQRWYDVAGLQTLNRDPGAAESCRKAEDLFEEACDAGWPSACDALRLGRGVF